MGVSAAPRRRRTPRSVHLSDKLANSVIRLGGVAVIAAVLGICLYLAAVVVPLFLPGTADLAGSGVTRLSSSPVAVLPDEYGGTAALVQSDGSVESIVLDSGQVLGRWEAPTPVSAVSVTPQGQVAWGFEDGTFQLGELKSVASTLSPERGRALGDERVIEQDGPFRGFRSLAESGTERVTTFRLETREATGPRSSPGPVSMLDYRVVGGGREMLFTAWEDGTARLNTVRVVRPLDGSEPKLRLSGRAVELENRDHGWAVAFSDGDSALTVGRDGQGIRYGVPSEAGRSDPLVAMERLELAGGAGIRALAVLPGARSLVAGSEEGSIWVWTLSRDPVSNASDRKRLVLVERIGAGGEPIVALTCGQRDRTVTAANAIGEVRQFHITSGKLIASLKAGAEGVTNPDTVAMSPRQDMILVADSGGRYARWSVEPGHPGAGWRALFSRVVYEGETEPSWVYQSSSAEDAAEIKLSLVPLIFGTFKATIVAMLIAAPLSVLAAIYSSEFLHRRVRSTVKPVIELMASLPSVVLGFIAMAVVAPWVGEHLAGVMLG
ncbi:MAG: hypothetical protein KDB18_11355, partial [Salinibacterium sp.]|nr:hypothetical protein [Salinibacterium sp.]